MPRPAAVSGLLLALTLASGIGLAACGSSTQGPAFTATANEDGSLVGISTGQILAVDPGVKGPAGLTVAVVPPGVVQVAGWHGAALWLQARQVGQATLRIQRRGTDVYTLQVQVWP